MKFSEQWLRSFVDPQISTADLAEKLTMAGLEIESIVPAALDFRGVVVGEVLEVEKHPDADKLHICKVDVAAEEVLEIVCGARNVRTGLKVAVAKVGAVLPENFKIKQAKLRGVVSSGMLCSESELGLAKTSAGIMELPKDAGVGGDFREYLEINDNIIDVSITPNRGDCLSIRGMAREVAALTKAELNSINIEDVTATISDNFNVEIKAQSECSHYCGRVIKGVNSKAATTLWMQERLRRSGINTISAIVDITNYVMLELGQPLHAFDLDKLHGKISVRHAKAQEKLTLLDQQELTLNERDVVIADQNEALALAGVMGGLASSVTDVTQDIFLESAGFDVVAVANTAKRHGLQTDSSYRFERGVDPELQNIAIERATALILEIAGGQAGPIIDVVGGQGYSRAIIQLRRERIKRILGIEIPDAEIVGILQRLGMFVEKTGEGWQVTVPGVRFDIVQEIDLIEELIRVYGYDEVPVHRPKAALAIQAESNTFLSLTRIRSFLVDKGYNETITYSFVDKKQQQILFPEVNSIELNNPISQDMAVMRISLWPGLLKTIKYNQSRQQERLRLFESGLCFTEKEGALQQYSMLGGAVVGSAFPRQWGIPKRKADFFDVKGDIEALLSLTNRTISFKADTHTALHPGKCAKIYLDKIFIGYVGEIHPKVKQKLSLQGDIFLFELSLNELSEIVIPQFQRISKYPQVERDLALLVDAKVSSKELFDLLFNKGGQLLKDVQLFDIYTGTGVAEGKKSVALRLILQHASRTLMDSEVEDYIKQLLQELKSSLNVELRG